MYVGLSILPEQMGTLMDSVDLTKKKWNAILKRIDNCDPGTYFKVVD
jgi:hypothetical protein